jgi:hypothetical protein
MHRMIALAQLWIIAFTFHGTADTCLADERGVAANVGLNLSFVGQEAPHKGKIQVGEPIFVKFALSNGAGVPRQVVIDGPSLGKASWELLVSHEGKPFEAVQLSEVMQERSGEETTLVVPPAAKLPPSSVVALWFAARTKPPVDGRPRPLIFDKPGKWTFRFRFHHVACVIAGEKHWVDPVTHLLPLDVVEAGPATKAFVEQLAPRIGDRHAISPDDRAALEKWTAPEHAPVNDWAQWLLIRSWLNDGEWWDALGAQKPEAARTLKDLLASAQRFLRDEKYARTPLRYEAELLRAVDAAAKGDHAGAAALMKAVYEKYGDAETAQLLQDHKGGGAGNQ